MMMMFFAVMTLAMRVTDDDEGDSDIIDLCIAVGERNIQRDIPPNRDGGEPL
jgi:hypothetical protein